MCNVMNTCRYNLTQTHLQQSRTQTLDRMASYEIIMVLNSNGGYTAPAVQYMYMCCALLELLHCATQDVYTVSHVTPFKIPADNSVTASLVTFAQQRIEKELTEKLFV